MVNAALKVQSGQVVLIGLNAAELFDLVANKPIVLDAELLGLRFIDPDTGVVVIGAGCKIVVMAGATDEEIAERIASSAVTLQ